MNWFVGMPKGNPEKNSHKNFAKKFAGTSTLFFKNFFPKRNSRFFFRKVQDSTRIKYIKQTNKDKVRTYLEKQAHFPQENPSFLMVLRKTMCAYFLPFPPPPPLEDPRNIFPENKKGSEK